MVRDTGAPDHNSYYHQDIVAQIEKYEMACFSAQQLLLEDYPTRYYWGKFKRIVGASEGQETPFMLVEHNASTGEVHGHPVTRQELHEKGVPYEALDS